MASPRVFTVPASAPFIPTVIRTLVEGTLVPGFPESADPLALAGATLYLPTRRACRLAREIFLDVTAQRAAVLPRIVALGDLDEDEIVFAEATAGAGGADALGLPPELGGLERRLLLARLVCGWASSLTPDKQGEAALVADNPASALALADDLARLMDDMTTRNVPWERLDDIVPDNFDRYWQLTLAFLKIARETWPAILTERGRIDPAERRDALIKAEARRLASPGGGPVIAAGSTGSMPATAGLIATIASLPHGAVVLPGLDTDLDRASWDLIAGRYDRDGREIEPPAFGHPQFAMQALLRRIGIDRAQVQALTEPALHGRERYVSEALRPAGATDRWHELTATPGPSWIESALDKLAVIEAANAEEEALAIAIVLRETLEVPGRTAALVTPDRTLARRVLAALARWNVLADDSGGDALAETAAGRFARLAGEAALGGLAPVSVLALLKHPLLRLGAPEEGHAGAIAALEKAVLRGPRPRPGTRGLAQALAALRSALARTPNERAVLHASDHRNSLRAWELDAADRLVERLTAALAPLEGLAGTALPFAEIAAHHRQVIEALSMDRGKAVAAFTGPDGIALATALDEIALDRSGLVVRAGDYAELFRAAISDRMVRRPGLAGVRIRIYGPLEARLQSVDRIVLGGLVEGTWPPETRADPWLNRPMRHLLELDLPERRTSLSAHDFAQALGAAEVILTGAAKLAGAPTVPSRFLQRLSAVAGRRWQDVRARGERYLEWARALDHPVERVRIRKPMPRPPIDARPRALSVTDIENWLRDPYTIYAKHILRLRELDPIDLAPGAADRGTVIHGAISEFTAQFGADLPDDPEAELLAIGRRHFATLDDYPEARAFWWPRFERIARWFAGWETERRAHATAVAAELSGSIEIALGERSFTLRGRADRIEKLPGGDYAILDYKTGQVPTDKQVRIGISPQLTLEAAILRGGGFPDIPADSPVANLVYVSLKGGVPAGETITVDFKDGNAQAHADRALTRLAAFAARFDDQNQPYVSLVLSMWKHRYGTYDHLARVKEWSVGGDDEDEDAGAE